MGSIPPGYGRICYGWTVRTFPRPPPFFRPPDQVKAWEDDGRLKAREEQGRQAEQVLSIMHGDVPPVQLTKVLNDHQTTWCMITPNHLGEGLNL